MKNPLTQHDRLRRATRCDELGLSPRYVVFEVTRRMDDDWSSYQYMARDGKGLLKLIMGILEPDEGEIDVCGYSVTSASSEAQKNKIRDKLRMSHGGWALRRCGV